VLAIAAAAGASMLVFATRFGFHRDELYFIAAGYRPEAGYVDQPPLVPLIARAADAAFGGSLLGLRSLTVVLVAVGVVLVALLARELGGGRVAQVLAAFTVAASPLLRSHNVFFGTTGVDQLMWAITLLAAARLVRTGNPRWWVAVGVGLGFGLETKATIVLLAVGLVVGALADRRWDVVRSWWFAAGVAAAFVIWAPNLLWNAANEWALVTFSEGKHSHIGDLEMYVYFVIGQLLMSGVTTVFVWAPGWRWLFDRRAGGSRFRALGITGAFVTGVLFLMGAKYYYGGPVYFLLFAAGAVALEAGVRRTRIVATWMAALSIVLCAPVSLPLLPTGQLDQQARFNRDYPEMVGWPELAAQVRGVVAALPPDEQANTVVFAGNYGEAGAIEKFAPELDVYSGHNSYWDFGQPPDTATTVVLLGFDEEPPTGICNDPERVATVTNDAGLANYEAGLPIWLCRDMVRPWSEEWPRRRQAG
jgi:4-amino-4-deoxy-L-arabinose transferase-like glycosyltransferase